MRFRRRMPNWNRDLEIYIEKSIPITKSHSKNPSLQLQDILIDLSKVDQPRLHPTLERHPWEILPPHCALRIEHQSLSVQQQACTRDEVDENALFEIVERASDKIKLFDWKPLPFRPPIQELPEVSMLEFIDSSVNFICLKALHEEHKELSSCDESFLSTPILWRSKTSSVSLLVEETGESADNMMSDSVLKNNEELKWNVLKTSSMESVGCDLTLNLPPRLSPLLFSGPKTTTDDTSKSTRMLSVVAHHRIEQLKVFQNLELPEVKESIKPVVEYSKSNKIMPLQVISKQSDCTPGKFWWSSRLEGISLSSTFVPPSQQSQHGRSMQHLLIPPLMQEEDQLQRPEEVLRKEIMLGCTQVSTYLDAKIQQRSPFRLLSSYSLSASSQNRKLQIKAVGPALFCEEGDAALSSSRPSLWGLCSSISFSSPPFIAARNCNLPSPTNQTRPGVVALTEFLASSKDNVLDQLHDRFIDHWQSQPLMQSSLVIHERRKEKLNNLSVEDQAKLPSLKSSNINVDQRIPKRALVTFETGICFVSPFTVDCPDSPVPQQLDDKVTLEFNSTFHSSKHPLQECSSTEIMSAPSESNTTLSQISAKRSLEASQSNESNVPSERNVVISHISQYNCPLENQIPSNKKSRSTVPNTPIVQLEVDQSECSLIQFPTYPKEISVQTPPELDIESGSTVRAPSKSLMRVTSNFKDDDNDDDGDRHYSESDRVFNEEQRSLSLDFVASSQASIEDDVYSSQKHKEASIRHLSSDMADLDTREDASSPSVGSVVMKGLNKRPATSSHETSATDLEEREEEPIDRIHAKRLCEVNTSSSFRQAPPPLVTHSVSGGENMMNPEQQSTSTQSIIVNSKFVDQSDLHCNEVMAQVRKERIMFDDVDMGEEMKCIDFVVGENTGVVILSPYEVDDISKVRDFTRMLINASLSFDTVWLVIDLGYPQPIVKQQDHSGIEGPRIISRSQPTTGKNGIVNQAGLPSDSLASNIAQLARSVWHFPCSVITRYAWTVSDVVDIIKEATNDASLSAAHLDSKLDMSSRAQLIRGGVNGVGSSQSELSFLFSLPYLNPFSSMVILNSLQGNLSSLFTLELCDLDQLVPKSIARSKLTALHEFIHLEPFPNQQEEISQFDESVIEQGVDELEYVAEQQPLTNDNEYAEDLNHQDSLMQQRYIPSNERIYPSHEDDDPPLMYSEYGYQDSSNNNLQFHHNHQTLIDQGNYGNVQEEEDTSYYDGRQMNQEYQPSSEAQYYYDQQSQQQQPQQQFHQYERYQDMCDYRGDVQHNQASSFDSLPFDNSSYNDDDYISSGGGTDPRYYFSSHSTNQGFDRNGVFQSDPMRQQQPLRQQRVMEEEQSQHPNPATRGPRPLRPETYHNASEISDHDRIREENSELSNGNSRRDERMSFADSSLQLHEPTGPRNRGSREKLGFKFDSHQRSGQTKLFWAPRPTQHE